MSLDVNKPSPSKVFLRGRPRIRGVVLQSNSGSTTISLVSEENGTKDEDSVPKVSPQAPPDAADSGPPSSSKSGPSSSKEVEGIHDRIPSTSFERRSQRPSEVETQDEEARGSLLQIVLADPLTDVGVCCQSQHDGSSWSTTKIPSVECTRCKRTILKYGALNKLNCVCGHAMCYVCRKSLPTGSGTYWGTFEHFCLHERYHSSRPCRRCRMCDLYDRHHHEKKQTTHEGSNCKTLSGRKMSRKDRHEDSKDFGRSKTGKVNTYERSMKDTSKTRHERWVSRQRSRVAPVMIREGDQLEGTSETKEDQNLMQMAADSEIIDELEGVCHGSLQDAAGRDVQSSPGEDKSVGLIKGNYTEEQPEQKACPSERLQGTVAGPEKSSGLQGEKIDEEKVVDFKVVVVAYNDDEEGTMSAEKTEQALQSGKLEQLQVVGDNVDNAETSLVIYRGERHSQTQTIGESHEENSSWPLLKESGSLGPATNEVDDQKMKMEELESWMTELTTNKVQTGTSSLKRKESSPVEKRVPRVRMQALARCKFPSRSSKKAATQDEELGKEKLPIENPVNKFIDEVLSVIATESQDESVHRL